MSMTSRQRRPTRWARMLFETTSTGPALDLAVLVVRIALAWIFIYYGAAKLFGAFPESGGPHGLHETAIFMSQGAHLRPGEFFAVLAGVTELGGGIAMALGLCTRLAGLALFGDMVMAIITVTGAEGFNPTTSGTGYQLNVAIAGLALVAVLIGAGRFSVDAMIAKAWGRDQI
ncbi:MAG: DoxX family protein [Nocardioidaceae bacterium]|nr:DoxX family protein [Nocardioidaceae bacterium]